MERRPHLTKVQRLPQCFKEAEKIIRSVKSCKSNFKTLLANSRLRGYIYKKVYSLSINTLKNYSYIQTIIDNVQLLEKEKYLRREISSILIYELLFGTGTLPGENKAVTTILMYESDIRHAHELLKSNLFQGSQLNVPRYVRVHTLVTTVPYVIKDLESYGYRQIFYDDSLTEEKYFDIISSLEKGSFLIDFHFKDVLVFDHSENLTGLDLHKNGHIFLQDKSSYIPVHVLNPEPGSSVLDACAAPGMKTLHIASKMKNKGILIACERDKSRFDSLKNMLDSGAVKICKSFCKDFKLIDPNDPAYFDLEYILLDPSCSGSGMVNRLDEITDTEDSKNKERLNKLAGFQIILLKHALKFPSVKRVVYSTCSIHEEENEYVVHEALASFSDCFKLVSAMPGWSQRGLENYEFGNLCLRTVPDKHKTNGFFVAVFERISSVRNLKREDFDTNYEKRIEDRVYEPEKTNETLKPFQNIESFKEEKKECFWDVPIKIEDYEKRIEDRVYEPEKTNETLKPFQNIESFKEEKKECFWDVPIKIEDHKKRKQNYVHPSNEILNKDNYKSNTDGNLDNFDSVLVKKEHKKRKENDVNEFLHESNEKLNDSKNKIIDEDMNNLDSIPIKKKKHKKRKENDVNELLHESNEELNDRESKNINNEDMDTFNSISIKKKKHKKRKENDVNEFLHESNEELNDRQCKNVINEDMDELNSTPVKKKKHKKKKENSKDYLQDSNELNDSKNKVIISEDLYEFNSIPIKKKHKKKKKNSKDFMQNSNEMFDKDTNSNINEEKTNSFDYAVVVNKEGENSKDHLHPNETEIGKQDYCSSNPAKSKKHKKEKEKLSNQKIQSSDPNSDEQFIESSNECMKTERHSNFYFDSGENKQKKRKENVGDYPLIANEELCEKHDFDCLPAKKKKHKRKEKCNDFLSSSNVNFCAIDDITIEKEKPENFDGAPVKNKKHKKRKMI